jgi:hypothetical protein
LGGDSKTNEKKKKKLERKKKLCGEKVGGKLITKHRHCTMYTREEMMRLRSTKIIMLAFSFSGRLTE